MSTSAEEGEEQEREEGGGKGEGEKKKGKGVRGGHRWMDTSHYCCYVLTSAGFFTTINSALWRDVTLLSLMCNLRNKNTEMPRSGRRYGIQFPGPHSLLSRVKQGQAY